ncbi:MAG: hypothetical protein QM705_07260 [Ancrocorticia sp.]
MSWQPMMYIPRATRMRGRTWIVAVLSPFVALLVTYLVALLSLSLGPSLEQLAQAVGEDIPPLSTALPGLGEGGPSIAFSTLILTLAALAAPLSISVTLNSDLGFPLSLQASLWAVPLTLTLVAALVMFLLHRNECRGISQAGFMVALPALLSGVILAAGAAVASLFTTINTSASSDLFPILGGDLTFETSTSLDATWLVVGAFVLGFFPAALARLNAIRPRRSTYVYTSLPSHAHAFGHALRTSFTVVVGAALATGAYLAVYALFNLDGLPATTLFYGLPFLVNMGIACIFGAIGGLGVVTVKAPSELGIPGGPENETIRTLIFDGAPWTIWVMAAFVVPAFVMGALYWGRTRDPRTERGFLSWLALPLSFTCVGFLAIALNMLVAGGSFFGETLAVMVRLSWLDLLWIIGIGILMEIISRFTRPKGPLSPEQLVPGIYQGSGQPAPGQVPFAQQGPGQPMPEPYPVGPGSYPVGPGQVIPGQQAGPHPSAPGQPVPGSYAPTPNRPVPGQQMPGPADQHPHQGFMPPSSD